MRYIDIEGTDGCGKATQAKMLFDYLVNEGYRCKVISFPNYDSPTSEPIKMYLNGDFGGINSLDAYQVSSMYAVDRMVTLKSIKEEYDFIIFDRYTPSNMIHQSTKIESIDKLNLFLDWCEDLEYHKLHLPIPNDIVFLDVSPDVSINLARGRSNLKNGQSKDILEADDNHMYKAYDRAKFVANKYKWKRIDCVDNGKIKSVDIIHKEIIKALDL